MQLSSKFLLPCRFLQIVCLFFLSINQSAHAFEKYNITYEYRIKSKVNGAVRNTVIRVPIPKNCSGQKILKFNLYSIPKNIKPTKKTDQYGQSVAVFKIPELTKGKEVVVGFNSTCEFKPVKIPMNRTKTSSKSRIPSSIKKLYTTNIRSIYDLDNKDIKSISQQFRIKYPNLVERVRAIHNYVASLLEYKRDKKWRSASYVIRTRKGSCSEFCFLFSALCRANGIPTRFVGTSRLRTTNKFPYRDKVWHRFVEVYLSPYGWVPFDPTRDRGNPPKQKFVGSYEFRSLIVMRGGGNSSIMGRANYIGSNNNSKSLSRSRVFIWNKIE